MKRNYKTLLLNQDFFPLTIVSWQKAMTLICKDVVHQIDFYKGDSLRDGRGHEYPVPCVIALKAYLHRDHKKAPFNRRNILMRDGLKCQYCGQRFHAADLTLDHVVPKSKGGHTSWTNIVAACYPCNGRKKDRSCGEIGMYPIKTPAHPGYNELFLGIFPWQDSICEEWKPYLQVLPSFKEACSLV